ncbi:MAG: hypothetical protein H0U73_12035 [Tatlockia sp.]|nr:hypothetical protein [Tatlockia sp.]
MSDFSRAVGRAFKPVTNAFFAIKEFLLDHWVTTAIVILGLLAVAGLITAIVFTGPAIPTIVAGLLGHLPWVGTAASAWLTGLAAANLPAAAAVSAAVGFGAYVIGYTALVAVGKFANWIYEGVDHWMTKDLSKNKRVDQFVQVTDGDNKLYKLLEVNLTKKPVINPLTGRQEVDRANRKLFEPVATYYEKGTNKPLSLRQVNAICSVNDDVEEDSDDYMNANHI